MVILDLKAEEKAVNELCEERERLVECLFEARDNDGTYYDEKTGLDSEEEFEKEIELAELNLDMKYSFIAAVIFCLNDEDKEKIQDIINNAFTGQMPDKFYQY